jgi:hypothetical protein
MDEACGGTNKLAPPVVDYGLVPGEYTPLLTFSARRRIAAVSTLVWIGKAERCTAFDR